MFNVQCAFLNPLSIEKQNLTAKVVMKYEGKGIVKHNLQLFNMNFTLSFISFAEENKVLMSRQVFTVRLSVIRNMH